MAEVLVELENFAGDLRKLAVGLESSRVQRLATHVVSVLVRHLPEILVEVGCVALDQDRVHFSAPLLIEQTLLELFQIVEDALCVV